MKIKNKGKVHPSPSSSSSSSASASASHSSCGSATSRDVLSVLKLLPAAIFALATVLSLEDREVLAYMITRSLDTAAPAAAGAGDGPGRKKGQPSKKAAAAAASAPSFDCDCFDCYGSYWHRWDSSANRELIHQAIEAFEDHIASGELGKNKNGGGGGRGKAKRRERDGRMARRAAASGQPQPEPEPEPEPEPQMPVIETAAPPEAEDRVAFPTENEASAAATPATSPERAGTENFPEEAELSRHPPPSPAVHDVAARRAPAAVSSHKGLARKVLPDVLGILNSRLWSLWSPNV